jgi:hypothetical protein
MYLPFKIEIAQVQALECHVAELHAKMKLLQQQSPKQNQALISSSDVSRQI